MDLFRSFIYIKEKGGFQEQNPMEQMFELPEYLRYDHWLKKNVSCSLGMVQTTHLQFLLHQNNLVS